MNRYEDQDGQVDGDGYGNLQPYATSMQAQPWLRGGIPPWHMWGNSQTLTIDAVASDEPTTFVPGQLAKVSYKRPESWHWVFAARLVSFTQPIPGVGATARITVHFDLIIGSGRAQQTLPSFDRFDWVWEGLQVPPMNHVMWSSVARTPPLGYRFNVVWEPDPATIRTIETFTAQDIQLTTRLEYFLSGFASRPSATVEVAAFLAPKTHVRPDWMRLDVPPESQFGGAEIEGR
jgi:hypothetical protein